MHGLTYSGHAAACAVGLRNIELIEENDLVGNSQEMGVRLRTGLQKLADEFDFVDNIRGMGLLCGSKSSPIAPAAHPTAQGSRQSAAAMARGLRVRPVGAATLALSPSLAITPDEVDTIIELLGSAMDVV